MIVMHYVHHTSTGLHVVSRRYHLSVALLASYVHDDQVHAQICSCASGGDEQRSHLLVRHATMTPMSTTSECLT